MFDPYHKWLGIPPAEQPPHFYRLLGITPFESDHDVIEAAADRQMSYLKDCGAGPHIAASQRLLNEVSTARVTLLNPNKKHAYDEELHRRMMPTVSSINTRQPRANPAPWVAGGLIAVALVGFLGVKLLSPASGPRDVAKVDPAAVKNATPVTPEVQPPKTPDEAPRPVPPPDAPKTPTKKPEPPKPEPPKPAIPSNEPPPDEGKKTPDKEPDPLPAKTDPESTLPPLVPRDPKTNPDATTPPKPVEPAKLPVPDKDAIAASEKLIKELFKADYASRKPDERVALANKLLQQGIETANDPNAQYVLFVEAQETAGGLGEIDVALKANDELAKRFKIDEAEERFNLLSTLSRAVRTPESNQALLTRTLAALESSIADDHYEAAKKLATLGGAVARKAQNVREVGQLVARLRQIEVLKKEFDKSQEAKASLDMNPNDPDANLTLGKFLCFAKGDFADGLPLLAKGADEGLKQLAAKDLAKPVEPADQVAVADAWWDLGEKDKDVGKPLMQARAVEWYSLALPNLKGLPKAQIEAKLKTATGQSGTPRKASGGNAVARLGATTWRMVFPNALTYSNMVFQPDGTCSNHVLKGTWELDGGVVRVRYPDYPSTRQHYWFEGPDLLCEWYENDVLRYTGKGFPQK